MRKKPRNIVVRDNGRLLHRAEQRMITIVPVTIRWTRRKSLSRPIRALAAGESHALNRLRQ